KCSKTTPPVRGTVNHCPRPRHTTNASAVDEEILTRSASPWRSTSPPNETPRSVLNLRNMPTLALLFSSFASSQTANTLSPDAVRPVILGEMKGLAITDRRFIGVSKLMPPLRLPLKMSADGGDGICVDAN